MSSRVELATFQVGEALCGMEILQIQEINKLNQLTRVPQAPADVLGILNLRGQIVTVLDLARRLGLGATEPDPECRVIIVNSAGGKVGILVHRISDVVSVDLRGCSQITWTKLRSGLGQIWLWRPAQKHRRSSATSRILRLSRSQRWPEDEMKDVQVIC